METTNDNGDEVEPEKEEENDDNESCPTMLQCKWKLFDEKRFKAGKNRKQYKTYNNSKRSTTTTIT